MLRKEERIAVRPQKVFGLKLDGPIIRSSMTVFGIFGKYPKEGMLVIGAKRWRRAVPF